MYFVLVENICTGSEPNCTKGKIELLTTYTFNKFSRTFLELLFMYHYMYIIVTLIGRMFSTVPKCDSRKFWHKQCLT